MTDFLTILYSPDVLRAILLTVGFLSVFILIYTIVPDESQAAARKRLGVTEDSAKPDRIALFRWFHPLYVTVLHIFYSDLMPSAIVRYLERQRPIYHRKLITANIRDEITPDEFVGFKVVISFTLSILAIFIAAEIGRPISWPLWPFILLVGFYAADFWLAEIIGVRRRQITRAMPYTLDLLTLSVEAGMDFIAAIQRLAQRNKDNALVVEFAHMLKEIRLGTSRSDALRSLADRLQIEEISSFTTLLIQADQLGASIGTVLRAQSDQLRTKRFQAAETAGAKASQLVLFPLVLVIFPAIFIVVLGPTVLNFLAGGLMR